MTPIQCRLDFDDYKVLRGMAILDGVLLGDILRRALKNYVELNEVAVVLRQRRSKRDVVGDYENVCFEIDSRLKERCWRLALGSHLSPGQIIRNALADYIETHKGEYAKRLLEYQRRHQLDP